jgi:hypothetical protein
LAASAARALQLRVAGERLVVELGQANGPHGSV